MNLVDRISLTGPPVSSPEDILSTALSTLDPNDQLNLPKPLHFELADPAGEADRKLFSHYLWNPSLLLAELIEAGSLGLDAPASGKGVLSPEPYHFNVRAQHTIELGAGTALPSIMAGLLGASRVVITDYPALTVLTTLNGNVARNVTATSSLLGKVTDQIIIEGHAWGDLDNSDFAGTNRHAFDSIFVADCLWMPWQQANLLASICWFLAPSSNARVWVVAGFHTGRGKVRGFFYTAQLGPVGLEVERIWERDVLGAEREWNPDRRVDNFSGERRWLVVAVLKRKAEDGQEGP
ncbi:hypothetical protein SODALDRAFT_339425 [Sodiomyces alkalinus F11]|uniref:Nicotinamide N-methyltransferase n=1 Tax=Sodiomyces alkalinus (strain CBS 110278 / VKM F-3762 / F11) TaxID=1314773 RepID=A0A3N2Q045_SODAK|nr:hypothetical protein SODALDRAFT_339425 [Sodiomyces alkalinus F11]ROT40141.1 hypothetical protein SODALDRAFT_339425 [Sodiomyces alkalinus F11]